LTAEEYDQLERNIIEDGCHDKLIVWQETQTLLDGHNRYEICQRHHIELAGLTELSFPDLDAAKLWMIAQQFGRRNLTPEQVSNLRGTQYHLHKKMTRVGGDRKSAEAQDQKAQSEPFDNTADELAVQHKVSPSTIKRDAAYAKALKTIADTVGT